MGKKSENAKNPRSDVPEDQTLESSPPEVGGEGNAEPQADELSRLKDQLLRQAAEYDNYRKRTAKERMELVPGAIAKTVAEFLPVIDNIERAFAAECSDANYKKGIEMIYASFLETLKNLGVEEIVEEDFNPAVHQAVQHVESEDLESGKVARIFQKGYKIGNRVIRFAMVAIVK
ncbi:MAG: nucleotide exchange factor GrpE [Oscillospiraceae bacterium]|nr:nucleotide exchange factor GrpE [Oscillospiraceae bacterium]